VVIGRAVSMLRELIGNSDRIACDHEWIDIWTNATNPMKMPKRALQRD